MTNKELQQLLSKYPEDAKMDIILLDYFLDPYTSDIKDIQYNQELNTISLEPDQDLDLDQL